MMGLEEFGMNEIVFLGSYYIELLMIVVMNNLVPGAMLIFLSTIFYAVFEGKRQERLKHGN